MELHCERECLRILDAYGLDHAVVAQGFDAQTIREAIDGLGVCRADLGARVAPEDLLENAAPLNLDLVRIAKLFSQRLGLIRAMIALARHFVHALVQRAAEG